MKNFNRIIAALVLTIIYCFAIVVVSNSHASTNVHGPIKSEKVNYFSEVSTNILSHTSTQESSLKKFNNFPALNFKYPFSGIWGIIKTTEDLYRCEYSQYAYASINFLIEYRKSDLIFPFHYFW